MAYGTQNADIDLANVPGGHIAVWGGPGGEIYLVYRIPHTRQVMLYTVPSVEDYKSMLGPEQEVVVNRNVTQAEIDQSGAINFGSSVELVNKAEHPFENWMENLERQAQIAPWLLEDDAINLLAEAELEGRSVTQAEWQTTDWWQRHTASERQWLELYYGDPSSAEQMLEDAYLTFEEQLRQAGVTNAPDSMARLMANKATTGEWSQAYIDAQFRYLRRGEYERLDADLVAIAGGAEAIEGLEVSLSGTERVRQLVNQWVGPAVASNWSEDDYRRWADTLVNQEGGEDQLVGLLRQQRLSLFPAYENPELSYADIAAPWKQVWQQEWGEVADESSDMFWQIVNQNDMGYARRKLREEGLARNKSGVLDRIHSGALGTFDPVRRSLV